MTKQEAIAILQEERDYAQFPKYVKEALLIAKEAIEKQIPKKGKIVCPSCGCLIGSSPYCRYCGQAIEWGNAVEGEIL